MQIKQILLIFSKIYLARIISRDLYPYFDLTILLETAPTSFSEISPF